MTSPMRELAEKYWACADKYGEGGAREWCIQDFEAGFRAGLEAAANIASRYTVHARNGKILKRETEDAKREAFERAVDIRALAEEGGEKQK
jgi:hypothetical protein